MVPVPRDNILINKTAGEYEQRRTKAMPMWFGNTKVYLSAFYKKIAGHLLNTLWFTGACVFYLFRIRILINCRTYGIGHLAVEPGWFIVKKKINPWLERHKYILLLANDEYGIIANHYLLSVLNDYFIIFRSRLINQLLKQVSRFPFISIDIGKAPPPEREKDKDQRRYIQEANTRNINILKDIELYRKNGHEAIIFLPDNILEKGEKELKRLGIDKDEWFVCLHASEVALDGDCNYHPWRRQVISDYYGMIRHIADIGGRVVRMGHPKLPHAAKDIPLIDYPKTEQRSDWMDIFLISRCRYFIGCLSGLQWVAVILGKPQILTNIIAWQTPPGLEGDIYLPKMIRSEKTGAYLTADEFIDNNFDMIHFSFPPGFTSVPNSEEDLISAVDEMEQQLKNGLTDFSPLQKAWKQKMQWGRNYYPTNVKISESFIDRYKDLLLNTNDI
jgi:putative glycosyltransferase (TIGR04372 family)